MRSSGGTNFGLALSVVARTNSTIACFAGPSFHEGSGSSGLRDGRCESQRAEQAQRQKSSIVREWISSLCPFRFHFAFSPLGGLAPVGMLAASSRKAWTGITQKCTLQMGPAFYVRGNVFAPAASSAGRTLRDEAEAREPLGSPPFMEARAVFPQL